MLKVAIAAFAAACCVSAAAAQESPANDAPVVATPAPPVAPPTTTMLPANTEILVSLNEELSSRRNRQGETFSLSIVGNVMLGNYIVIPAGTRVVGEITWVTGRGMFGKSGKMAIAIRYIDLNGRQIPLVGTFLQQGEGNAVATVASVAVVPVAGLFITGHSAVIPAGRQFSVRLRDDLPVILPGADTVPLPIPAGAADTPSTAPAMQQPAPMQPQ